MKWSQHCLRIDAIGRELKIMRTYDDREEHLCLSADLNAIQETAYLLFIRGMGESIKAGMAERPEVLAKSLDW